MTSREKDAMIKGEHLFLQAEHYEEAGDFKRAFWCLLRGAQLGHAMSQVNLGNYYSSGRGIRRNLEQAAHWYKRAYKNGYRDGALNLAIDRKKAGNSRSAVTWFKKAIALNSGDACIELAKMYSERNYGKEAASELLRQALRMGRDNISQDGREKAESLLKAITKG